jgi:exosortase K
MNPGDTDNINPMKMPKHLRLKAAQLTAVAVLAGAGKFFHANANVNDLQWILAPTAWLVELANGERFEFESYAGYINDDRSFLIAGSCSGMNFLIIAFVMLSLLRLFGNARPGDVSWRFVPVAALIAFFATIVANAVRISVALRINRMQPEWIWVNPDQLHRFQGIFVYFGFLLLLFILSEKLRRRDEHRTNTHLFRFWRFAAPLLAYWAMTLGIPLLNGARRQDAPFLEHSLFVILTSLALILPIGIIEFIRIRRASL